MPAEPSILVINGPNLNMLGVRDPDIHGVDTLSDIEAACLERAGDLALSVEFKQSNLEGELIGWVQAARVEHDGIIINAGGYAHSSIALLDALLTAQLPVIEVHLTNIFQREAFRHNSFVSIAAVGVICGFGSHGYLMALDAMARLLEDVTA